MNKKDPQTTSYTIWFYCTQRAKQTPAAALSHYGLFVTLNANNSGTVACLE